MTAPLVQKTNIKESQTLQAMTLRVSTYQLLDAIDDNNIENVELLMTRVLKNKVPEVSIRMFLNYAERNKKVEVCEYLRLILVATYNTEN